MKRDLPFRLNEVLLLFALVVCFPLFFENALEHQSPMGYAGLFTQMSEQIANANFQLPLESPFYGPGGIPFAYPPFGLYLLAILIKLTGKYFIFLRVLPPLLSLTSLIPLFYLTLELSKSAWASAIAVILAATSQDLYTAHAWAAGIVRASAFLFALTSLYFFSRQLNMRSRSNTVLTGIFLGLAFMSHLLYGLFCILWIVCWTLFDGENPLRIRFKDAMVIFIVSALIVSIWLVPTLLRHGVLIFFNAFNSHGGGGFLSPWQDIQGLANSFWIHVEPIISTPILSILVLLGIISLLLKRQYTVVLFYLFIILIFPESERFVFLVGCIVTGIGLSILMDWSQTVSNGRVKPLIFVVILVPILTIIWWSGFKHISAMSPNLDGATLDLAREVQTSTRDNETYLALIKQDEAEWLPFLFQREPIVAQWGSEWLGEYDRQTHLMSLFRVCQRAQDWPCVEKAIIETGKKPNYLITYLNDKQLNDQLRDMNQWSQVYKNDRYVVWSRIN